jgi:hypothetical protein
MTTRFRTLLAAALLAAGTTGCAGGQTGNDGDSGEVCDEKARPLTLTAVSPLGFSAADVLAHAEAAHTTSFAWQPGNPVPYGPEQGTAELLLEVHSRGRFRFVERSPHDGPSTLVGGDCCPDSVQVDVRITLRTSGGALEETFDAVLDATRADAAHVQALLKPPLNGTLTFDQRALGSQHLEDLQLDARFAPGDLSGALHARIESEPSGEGSDSSVSLSLEPLGQWGDWPATPLCSE